MKLKYLGIYFLIFFILLSALVYFFPRGEFYYKKSFQLVLPKINRQAEELPDKLVIAPGEYREGKYVFSMQKEGLYILKIGKVTKSRIVYKQDPLALISAIMQLDSPKLRTKSNKDKYIEEQAKKGRIGLSCGGISSFGGSLMLQSGLESRTVMAFNEISKDDGLDNGHTLTEVKLDGRYQVIDLDHNARFTMGDKYLSFYELFMAVKNDQQYQIERLSGDYDNLTDMELQQYYKKVFKDPFVAHRNKYFFFADSPEREQTLLNYAKIYRVLPKSEWLEKFYPGYNFN